MAKNFAMIEEELANPPVLPLRFIVAGSWLSGYPALRQRIRRTTKNEQLITAA